MSRVVLLEDFDAPSMDDRLKWYCPPARWFLQASRLVVQPDAKTDYWQKTHYGFAVDNGHFLYLEMQGDFLLSTRVHFFPAHQYDQAGLMVYISPECWLKTSVEYEPEGPNRLGAVVTRSGYSDWSTQNFPTSEQAIALRIRREGEDYGVEYQGAEVPESGGRVNWIQIRIAHLENPEGKPVRCGLYACSPIAAGYTAGFDYLKIEQTGS